MNATQLETYFQTIKAARVQSGAKYRMEWLFPADGGAALTQPAWVSGYSVGTIDSKPHPDGADMINFRTVDMGKYGTGCYYNVSIPVTDARRFLTRINVNNVNGVVDAVCADDNLELLYNAEGSIVFAKPHIPDHNQKAVYKKWVTEGTKEFLMQELRAAGLRRPRPPAGKFVESLEEPRVKPAKRAKRRGAATAADAAAGAAALLSLNAGGLATTPTYE